MPLLVIYNPVCGHGNAKELFYDTVLPLLREHGKEPDKLEETTHAGHAGDVVLDFLQSADGPLSIVLGSGDGTLHEILCAFQTAPISWNSEEIKIALVPCGTANALYSALFPPQNADEPLDTLKSLHTLLQDSPSTRQLTLASTSLVSPENEVRHSSISAVVTSTSLHASILHDSEALRASHPGIERFKIAAQQNITRWYNASVRLIQPCTIYRPSEDRFVPYDATELQGPFAYFLSTVNVDRLEPLFRITPLQSTIPPLASPHPPTLELVIVRPLRDKSIGDDSESNRERFSQKCIAVLGGAYQDGAHVKMVYGADGQVAQASAEGGGEPVVEYLRCGGWEWVPDKSDGAAHLVCADGEIFQLEPSNIANCTAIDEIHGYSFHVYA